MHFGCKGSGPVDNPVLQPQVPLWVPPPKLPTAACKAGEEWQEEAFGTQKLSEQPPRILSQHLPASWGVHQLGTAGGSDPLLFQQGWDCRVLWSCGLSNR